jgi:hypothetical protein
LIPKTGEPDVSLKGVPTMMFFWKLDGADFAEAHRVVEQLRQKAIDLKWLPVGEVVHLADQECSEGDRLPGRFLLIAAGDTVFAPHEAVFFEATPPGDEVRPFGLAAYPAHLEGSNKVVPTHLAGWQWVGVIRSSELQAVQDFIHKAAELGLQLTAAVGGKVLTAGLDEAGLVRYEERLAFPIEEDQSKESRN